ncbi:MAG: transporter substrate-binding domain-containing protein, partial [Thiohalocapsa sp.]
TWDDVRDLGPIRIGAPDNRTTGQFLRQRLPEAEPITFSDNADIDALLAADSRPFDALLMPAEEGAAWTIRYPRLSLVTPSPILLTPFSYSVQLGDTELLTFLNAWILNAQGSGTVDTLYRYWMLGDIGKTQPPRWSIAHNLLGWFDH